MNNSAIGPISPSERNQALDVLRGFAIFGILIMNIQSFAMVGSAYFNPTVHSDMTGLNQWIYYLSHIFADSKFMTIFSLLFGGSIIMITNRIETKGIKPRGVYYRRMLVLLLLGCMHAYLLWYGDVLVWYALCGFWAFLFRKFSPKWLIFIGLILLGIGSALSILSGLSLPYMPAENYQNLMEQWAPSQERLQVEIDTYQGTWLEQMKHRLPFAFMLHTFVFFFFALWRVGGLFLIGMALFKMGIFTAKQTPRFYIILTLTGFILGFPLVITGLINNYAANWSLDYTKFLGSQYNYWGSIPVSLGYIGCIMLACKSSHWLPYLQPMAKIGRTALSNYLLQTVICTTLFYGHGFGLFGQVERSGQVLIVLCVWISQLLITALWLQYFRLGPIEWIWRSLTYKQFQPLRQTNRVSLL
ncbi:DUF418 domain-containing protein [bacterium]|nr:DUF418 domain-containing protein [bacterium]